MTVIVVPETGKRTVTFRFSLLWLTPLAVLILGLALAVYLQHESNQSMHAKLTELDTLRRTNRLQEAEIETLRNKVTETDQKLSELEVLENQLRDIVGQGLPSRGSSIQIDPVHMNGRGGPPDSERATANLPTLGSMLPPDVRAYLFTRRDTLPMHLRQPAVHQEDPAAALTTVDDLKARLDQQLGTMTRLSSELAEGKETVLAQLDYLAHRPSGLPVSGGLFTDRFGWRWSPFGWGRQWHDGLDIAHDTGEPVVATADGIVIHAGWKSGGYGYTVMIDHGYGFVTMYAHLDDYKPDVWQEVKRGQVIGWVGDTGNSTGPHLHYEVHVNGVPNDPVKYLQ